MKLLSKKKKIAEWAVGVLRLPAALIRPRPHSGPAHGSRGAAAVGAARHLASDETECPPLPPTGADGKPAQILARAHRTVLPAALIGPRPHSLAGPAHRSRGAAGAVRHLACDETECRARPSPRPGPMVSRRNWREPTARSFPQHCSDPDLTQAPHMAVGGKKDGVTRSFSGAATAGAAARWTCGKSVRFRA